MDAHPNSGRAIKVLHLAPTLEVGGAERFIERLVPTLTKRYGLQQRVIGLSADGPVGDALRRAGESAEALSSSGLIEIVNSIRRVRKITADWRPDIVQTWLYRADLTGALATMGQPGIRLVWNLRCSDAWLNRSTRAIRRACIAIAKSAPDAIVACGERASSFHRELGYPSSAITMIPNGYCFPPLEDLLADRASRRAERSDKSVLLGAAGRYDRAKGYPYLLQAMAILISEGHDVRLAIAGRGCDPENIALNEQIRKHNLHGRVNLLGELSDLRSFYVDLDCFCLSSVSEGFPNVLCEAIASGVPAVATHVGDAPQIMGAAGTVPPHSAKALAEQIAKLITTPLAARELDAATSARRVRAQYALDAIAEKYYILYQSLMENADEA